MKTNWKALTKDQLVRRLEAAEAVFESLATRARKEAKKETDPEWRRRDLVQAADYEFALKMLREDPDTWPSAETDAVETAEERGGC